MKNLIILLFFLTITSFSNGTPAKCTSASCSRLNNNCVNYYCNPRAGCYGIDKCIRIDACHLVSCNLNNGSCINTKANCDDGDPCTDDFCHNAYGCFFIPNAKHPSVICQKNCNDNNPCTDDFCDFTNTCQHTLRNCEDNDSCTIDSCGPNGCIHTNISCDDNDPCTSDFCSMLYGCYHEPIQCSIKVPCSNDIECNRYNFCETYTCDLISNTCKYSPKFCNGWPCINNECMTGVIYN
ncbi:hypothetical protein ACTFIZ_008915 [Dictyostelium cf. discoideum]